MKEFLNEPPKTLVISIEGEMYEWQKQYITGAEIKKLAGITNNEELYLSCKDPYDDELINDATSINLARPGIEAFLVRKPLKFMVNNLSIKWHKQFISGDEIRKLVDLDSDDELYLKMQEPYSDELISNQTIIDLARPGIEKIISKRPNKFKIFVGGDVKEWFEQKISYEQVLSLVNEEINYETKAYTISYNKGPKQNPKGSMVLGSTVFVKSNMNFNVATTNKS